jgi:hypothetical protein
VSIGPWRTPGEFDKLYPGLSINDNRVSGSIVVGRTRLPVWAFIFEVIRDGYDSAIKDYSADEYGLSAEDCAAFIANLMQCRGEFGRLLLILADVERRERGNKAWWEKRRDRQRVATALRRCLAVVEDEGKEESR